MERYTLSVLVENNPGVLSRVVGLFSRRGFNIHSLSVGTTQDPQVSRITIEVNGDAQIVEQVSKQLSKIMEVIKIKTLRDGDIVKRGLALVKVKVTPKTRSEVIEITNVFRAKIVDISSNTLTIELTGHNKKLGAFLDLVEPYGIEEIACTGCSSHKQCTYHLVECIKEHNVEKCNQCAKFPCGKINDMLERSGEYQKRCKEVCSEEEYDMLEKAFFNKENNLRK